MTSLPGSESTIETRSLVKSFEGVRALDELSLTVPRTGVTGIIGPNGSGKSTLVNVLTGLLPIDGGLVVIGGEALTVVHPYENHRRGLTRTFQDIRLFEQMTVLDNLLVALSARPVYLSLLTSIRRSERERAHELLALVGLAEKRDAFAEELSYGQRKLLELARALAMGARTYLFDEPFAGLFPQMVDQVRGVLVGLRDQQRCVVLIDHNMTEIRSLCDLVIVLDSGELLGVGVPEDVLERGEVIEAYVGR